MELRGQRGKGIAGKRLGVFLLFFTVCQILFATPVWAEQTGGQWVKDQDEWHYLDGDGVMLTDQLIEYRDEIYYVDGSGKMAENQWVSIENGEGELPRVWWYYFQSDGRAMRGNDNGKVSLKTINDVKYAFDSQGRMLSGWVREDDASLMLGDEDAWREGDYYFGDENDGALSLGWRVIPIADNQADEENEYWINPAYTESSDQLRYFYFKMNGKKIKGAEREGGFVKVKQEQINGLYYGFDQYGRMLAEWSQDQMAAQRNLGGSLASNSRAWKNFNSVESGQRYTDGWFKVVPAERLDPGDYDDGKKGWYYADGNGHILAGEFKFINGKRYGFDLEGRMMDGFKMIAADGNRILDVVNGDDIDGLYFDSTEEFDHNAGFYTAMGYRLYFFGGEDDGAMRMGAHSQKMQEWDKKESAFFFRETGGKKGAGLTGRDDDKLYNAGRLMASDPYQKYQPVVNVYADVKREGIGDIRGGDSDGAYIGYYMLENAAALRESMVNGGIVIDDDGRTISVYPDRGGVTWIPVPSEWLNQPDAILMDNGVSTGITAGEFKKAAGLTADPDKYGEITAYVSFEIQTSGAVIYRLGLPWDLVSIVDHNGKIQEKNKSVKDNDGVHFKIKGNRLVATYTKD